VWLSGTLMIVGIVMAALHSFAIRAPKENPTLGALFKKAISGSFDPVTTMYLGLVLLMLTPFLRVLTAVAGFSAEKDWKFVGVAIIVFTMLIGELVISFYR
jgi:uncharacterized membrane protein